MMVENNSNGKKMFSFRRATGAHLFKDFIDILKKCSQSDIGTSTEGLLHTFDEGAM
jgi:hypothetical protein